MRKVIIKLNIMNYESPTEEIFLLKIENLGNWNILVPKDKKNQPRFRK